MVPFTEVFDAYRLSDLLTVQAKIRALDGRYHTDIYKLLALRALQDRRADALKFCLDRGGFPFEAYFEDEANTVKEADDPKTFQVLESSSFRKIYPRRDEKKDEEEDYGHPSAIFDKGGPLPVPW